MALYEPRTGDRTIGPFQLVASSTPPRAPASTAASPPASAPPASWCRQMWAVL